MMSQSHSHPQLGRRFDKCKTNQPHESSLSSSHHTTTARCSSFPSKLDYSSFSNSKNSNQHLLHQNLSDSSCSCLNVLSKSKRWTTSKSPSASSRSASSSRQHSSSMATQQGRFSFNVPIDTGRKKVSGQQKKEALEREVSMLQNMLKQEENMHEILERMHHSDQHASSAISIPNFLPPKRSVTYLRISFEEANLPLIVQVKELLAELAMVEGEITRLEGQISQLQLGLKNEQEVTKETKSKQWQVGNLSNLNQGHPTSTMITNPNLIVNRAGNEKMAFETKALHFISKAIKGDYNLSATSTTVMNERIGNSAAFADQKENQFHHDQDIKFQDFKVPRRSSSGILKPPSPFRDPRQPSPKPRERNPEISFDLPPRYISSTSILSEENSSIQNWQPNKLSESIIKCLNFIYVRLLRTSRAIELEKSGPISRSVHYSSLSSRSFRAETSSSLNSKSSMNMSQKDSRQQDPYGVFEYSEESIPRDIGPYKNLVIFSLSSMDPKCISSSSSLPLIRKILMNNLQTVELRVLTYQQKLAFWINMFNACIMQGFLQYGVPNTPEKLIALMNKATLNIGGNTINAQAIEHYILRSSSSSPTKEVDQKGENDDKEAIVRKLYGLESTDPNVTFALCYGTRSSPAVRIYTGENVIWELEKSKLEYLQASIVVTSSRRIAFPELLLRSMRDFAMDIDTLVEWVCHQLPTSGTLRKSMVDCFRQGLSTGKISTTVEKIPYDFEFQYLLAI
ncbi:hypothetical protein JRO89_XS10G0157800 [Xanthoceras sorbifolium]|uniref:DUF547 domain-containing protein n=1 Tax=Xanthoceras sorbifolium TaxID=99658 RepID=A0ABQ8HIW1_9ROSI|nr:hypothetical protein JRO89_XS10G0157800 [Xanthoceras sorbifolium]